MGPVGGELLQAEWQTDRQTWRSQRWPSPTLRTQLQEMDKNTGNTRQYRNTTVCVGFTERTSVVSIFRWSFVCLRWVVPVSVYYRLCLVTVRMKVLPNGTLVRFSKLTDWWRAFSCNICNRMATTLGVPRAADPKIMATHTDHGKGHAVA
jgi:hypothetical protein